MNSWLKPKVPVCVSLEADPTIRIVVHVIFLEQSKDVADERKVAKKTSYPVGDRFTFSGRFWEMT